MISWHDRASPLLAGLKPWVRGILAGPHVPLTAFCAGLAAALAHPPFGVIIGMVGFTVLYVLVDGANSVRPMADAFLRAWLGGCAYFLVGMWWLSEAFMVDVAAHGWQAPFAVGFLAAGLALFWGVAGAVYKLIAPPGPIRALVFAAVFSSLEWFRGHVLTGLPWDLPGNIWRAGGPMSQIASVIGVYGLTLVTLGVAASLGLLFDRQAGVWRWRGPVLGVVCLAAVWSFGALRLSQPLAPSSGPVVRIVQANVPQSDKWDLKSFTDILERYTRLTAQPSKLRRPDIVIWSETAIPALVDEYMASGTWTRAVVEDSLRPGQVLVFGVDREESDSAGRRDFNSLMIVRRQTAGFRWLSIYDKHHLVPFGEYFPVDSLAEATGLKKLVHVGDGFTPGPPARVLRPDGLPPLAPMICYESLFPSAISDQGGRAAWIVNVSNDAWFGRTSGPLQHFNLASYRAIEEGLPMARATPTGVSAMIDPFGRPLMSLGQGEEGVIDIVLPAPTPATIYHCLGDSLFGVVCFILIAHAMILSNMGGRGAHRSVSSLLRRTIRRPEAHAPRET